MVERGEPGRGQRLQRRHLRGDRGQQQRLGQPVVGAVRRGHRVRVLAQGPLVDLVQAEQQRAQLVGVELVRRPEQRGGLRVEGLTGLALDDEVEGVPDRDDLVDGQGVAALDQHLLHDLQRGPFALHHRGEAAQGRDQRRGERVGQLERLLVGAAVPLVGVHPVQQHVPHRGPAVDRPKRVLQRGPRGVVLGPQQAPVRDIGQVVVPERDDPEAALLVPEGAVEGVLLGAAGPGVGEPASQVQLPGHERDQRDRPPADGRLDQLGQLLRLPAEELPVLHRERQPQHQLVEEQHDGVVAEALGVRGDRGQPGVQVDVLGLLCVGTEVGANERRDELEPVPRGAIRCERLAVAQIVPNSPLQHS